MLCGGLLNEVSGSGGFDVESRTQLCVRSDDSGVLRTALERPSPVSGREANSQSEGEFKPGAKAGANPGAKPASSPESKAGPKSGSLLAPSCAIRGSGARSAPRLGSE